MVGALQSIDGKYTRVFGYNAMDQADPWAVFDVAVPFWANDLQVMEPGRGYWVYWVFATEDVPLVITNRIRHPW